MSLSLLQFLNYLLPLVTLTYLVRTLGAEMYGAVIFAYSFVQYFVILTDFGFNLFATKIISVYRGNDKNVSEIYFSIYYIKTFFIVVSFCICTSLIFLFPGQFGDKSLFYLTFAYIIGYNLIPIWFFQGKEKMKYLTAFMIGAKAIYTLSIFIFISSGLDYLMVPILNAASFLIAGIVAQYFVFKKMGVYIVQPSEKKIWYIFIRSSEFFLSRAAASFYTTSTTFLLGLFSSNIIVGYYAAAEKLYLGLQQMYTPFVNSLYPYMAINKNVQLFKKIFYVITSLNVIIIIFLYSWSGWIIKTLFGSGLNETVMSLNLLLLSLFFVVPSILLGYPLLAAMGNTKYANYSVVLGGLAFSIFFIFLVITNNVSIYMIPWTIFVAEVTVFGIRVYGVKKYELWNYES